MCGIVGYVGWRDAVPVLLRGLDRLEYQECASAGIAIHSGRGLLTRRVAGRVQGLADLMERLPVHGSCGIGGTATERGTHPPVDCLGRIAVVHNGIIENADALREHLSRDGHRFSSESDTETLAHLIEASVGDTLEERVIAALTHVHGVWGLAVVSDAEPEKIVVGRQGSPVLLGIGEGEMFVASDAAVLEQTCSVVQLDEGDIAVLTPTSFTKSRLLSCIDTR